MSRLQEQRTTILLYGEGLHDKILLRYLKSCYDKRDSGRQITINCGRGGSPADIVQGAINYIGAAYDLRAVKMDLDQPKNEIEKAELLARKNNIQLIWSKPCLETTLLHILEPKVDYSSKGSAFCKKRFERIYANSMQRADPRYLEGIIPKDKIEKARGRVSELDELIKIIEGNV